MRFRFITFPSHHPRLFISQRLNAPTCTARVYGTERQPFITEVYANNWEGAQPVVSGGAKNPRGYVAVELYNPYSQPLVLNHYIFGIITRLTNTNNPPLTITKLTTAATWPPPAQPNHKILSFNGGPNYGNDSLFLGGGILTIPAHDYVVLENVPPNGFIGGSPNDALYRPAVVGTPPADHTVYVPNLSDVMQDAGTSGGELVLLRPHLANDVNATDHNLSHRIPVTATAPIRSSTMIQVWVTTMKGQSPPHS